MTIWVRVGAALVPAAPLGAMKPTKGVAVVAKKPDGYVSVMVLLELRVPLLLVAKTIVAVTPVLPASRAEAAIVIATLDTASPFAHVNNAINHSSVSKVGAARGMQGPACLAAAKHA